MPTHVASVAFHVEHRRAAIHRLRHVREQLILLVRRNRRRVERDVVRAHANKDELDAVAWLGRDVGRLVAIALGIADHLHFMNRPRNGGSRNGASSWSGGRRRGSRRGGISGWRFLSAAARTEKDNAREEGDTEDAHF